MALFVDSTAVYEQRLAACGVPKTAIDTLVAAGFDTLGKLAFCSAYNPNMPDDAPLLAFFDSVLATPGSPVPAGTVAALRRAFFEAHTFLLSDLKSQVDRKDTDEPRHVPEAERQARLTAQRARLPGVSIAGVTEPSHSLVDLVTQMKEDQALRYIDLELCTARESEVRHGKVSKSLKADLCTDYLCRQAFFRRSLAFDQLDLISFRFLEAWIDYLFALLHRESLVIDGVTLPKLTLKQIVEADRQLFVSASELCRDGLNRTAAGTYPIETAITAARLDPLVTALLQPIAAFKRGPQDTGRHDEALKYQRGGKGKGKGRGKGRGKRGTGGGDSPGPRVPKEFIGLNTRTKEGENLCYGFSLAGCDKCSPGKKCPKGWHKCPKCLGNHSLKDCKQQISPEGSK